MLREERLNFILEKLKINQKVTSTELMAEFQVSEGTIRRDLNELEEKGLLQKVHGGAMLKPAAPRFFDGRMEYASETKTALAQKALPLIKEGQLIMIDGGTSNWHLAKLLPLELKATIFTNSIPIVNTLLNHPNIQLHFMGGTVFKESQVTIGMEVIRTINDLRADICFVGVRGVHPEFGITTLEKNEAEVKKTMTQRSSKVVVMATKDKLNVVDHYKICDFADIDLLITEEGIQPELIKAFEVLGVEVV